MACFVSVMAVLSEPSHAARMVTSYCPISKDFNIPSFHHYNYPKQYFRNVSLLRSNGYNCTSRIGSEITASSCFMDSLCPINAMNIHDALRGQAWPVNSEALRKISSAKGNHEARVLILGGSMTCGADAGSCGCDDSKVDSRCIYSTIGSAMCSWPMLFTHWLQTHYGAVNFTISNFATGGATSWMMAEIFGHYLGRDVLTDSDLVLIDHSVNDRGGRLSHLQKFETLVRCILAASNESSRPTVVVIEQGYEELVTESSTKANYFTVYRNISRHYGLHLISIRDVYNSYYRGGDAQHGVYQFDPAKTHMHTRAHMPWHGHLYMADILTSVIQHKLYALANDSDNNAAFELGSAYPTPAEYYPGSSAAWVSCDENISYFLDASPRNLDSPADSHLETFETVTAAEHGWREYTDARVPGWMINKHSAASKRELPFPAQQFPPQRRDTNSSVLLKIIYMRSFNNFGAFSVWLCNRKITLIDSLRESQRISIPESYNYHLTSSDLQRCTESARDNATVAPITLKFEKSASQLEARKHEKVKVMRVQLCHISPTKL